MKEKKTKKEDKMPKIIWLKPKETFARFGKVVGVMFAFALTFVAIDALVILVSNLG